MKKKSEMLAESRLRVIRSIPNFLTICNSLCGFVAILITLQAYHLSGSLAEQSFIFCWSACMILFAMVFDAFDGFTARLLNVASMHGIQMDSLSDMVTFGVAPATLVAIMAHNMRELSSLRQFIPVCFLCAVYLGCAALRLATYNVHAIVEKKSSETFSGLPSPGAAAAICSLVIYTAYNHGEMKLIIRSLPVYAAFLGILMVSNVPYMHFAKWLVSTRRNKKRLICLLLIVVAWAVTAVFVNPFITPVVLINAYVIWGPLSYMAVKLGMIKPHRDIIPEISEKDR